ncbi:hypothetical protein M8J77_020869 [Diaphorina citri]|nr:hypothetical protein M8J77_020869 [Diaphorina citri]
MINFKWRNTSNLYPACIWKSLRRKEPKYTGTLFRLLGGDGVHMLTKSASIKKHPPPLLRSRTLPAIVVPGLSILQAQISDNRSTSTLDTTCDGNSNTNMQSVLPSIIYDSNSLDPRRHLVHHRLSSPEASAGMSDAMLQLKISQPPRLSASGPSTTQTALYRLARLLNQNQKSPEAFHSATRRLSWERDEETEDLLNIPRSASIDSIVECRHCGVNIVLKLPSPLLNS